MGLPLPHPPRATVARGAVWHIWGIACLWAGSLFSAHALEINQASEAELDSVRGMGPAMSRTILAERQRQPLANAPEEVAHLRHNSPCLMDPSPAACTASASAVQRSEWPSRVRGAQ